MHAEICTTFVTDDIDGNLWVISNEVVYKLQGNVFGLAHSYGFCMQKWKTVDELGLEQPASADAKRKLERL